MITNDDLFNRPDEASSQEEKIFKVSEITREIKLILEGGFPSVTVEGEISNFKRHSSGHFYFSLKDAEAQISCVMWRGRNQSVRFKPEDGMKIVVLGSITLYERQGKYQIDVAHMRPAGIGELQLAFEALKRKLQDEGLFDPSHKRPLPAFPDRIGLVTSPTGAAIRDIFSVISRRFPSVQLILNPVRVQGESAAAEIADAINTFNRYKDVDVLIIGRGGGSLEDLWAFNEEAVARAVYASTIPVISAVGHEVDFTISDFTADVRAPTPSAAAELVVPDRIELFQQIKTAFQKMKRINENRFAFYRDRITAIIRGYALRRPADRLREYRFRLDEASRRVETGMARKIDRHRERLALMHNRLESLSPKAVLHRGYAIAEKADGTVIRRSADVEKDDRFRLRLGEGSVSGRVEDVD